MEDSTPDSELQQLTPRELLERLVSLQQQQTADLEAIRRHTGCVYAWLILSVVLGILVVLIHR